MRRGIAPWWRRLHLALNYLPVLIGGIFLLLALLIAANVTNLGIALATSVAWVVIVEEVLGRRPYIRRVGTELEIRNFVRVHLVRSDSITRVKLHTFRMGKDTCPAIKTADRSIPVIAYFGTDLALFAAELGVPVSGNRGWRRIFRGPRKPAGSG